MIHLRKKSIALILAVLLSLFCASCSASEQTPSTVRIGVTLYTADDTFIAGFVQNLEQMAQDAQETWQVNVNLTIMDGRENQATQIDQIDQFINQDYDIICVNIVDRTSAAGLIDQAREAQIPIIFFNREPVQEDLDRWEYAYYVGSDATISGTMQGEIVRDAWLENSETMDFNGDGIVQYVMLEGEAGHQDALLRTESSVDVLIEAGIQVEKLASDIANWKRGQAKTTTASWIETFGSEIEVVFSNNDDMALGAIDAYQETSIDQANYPFFVGVDATDTALTAIEKGLLDGTVRNDSEAQVQAMLDLALSLVMEGAPSADLDLIEDTYLWVPYTSVTLTSAESAQTKPAS